MTVLKQLQKYVGAAAEYADEKNGGAIDRWFVRGSAHLNLLNYQRCLSSLAWIASESRRCTDPTRGSRSTVYRLIEETLQMPYCPIRELRVESMLTLLKTECKRVTGLKSWCSLISLSVINVLACNPNARLFLFSQPTDEEIPSSKMVELCLSASFGQTHGGPPCCNVVAPEMGPLCTLMMHVGNDLAFSAMLCLA